MFSLFVSVWGGFNLGLLFWRRTADSTIVSHANVVHDTRVAYVSPPPPPPPGCCGRDYCRVQNNGELGTEKSLTSKFSALKITGKSGKKRAPTWKIWRHDLSPFFPIALKAPLGHSWRLNQVAKTKTDPDLNQTLKHTPNLYILKYRVGRQACPKRRFHVLFISLRTI